VTNPTTAALPDELARLLNAIDGAHRYARYIGAHVAVDTEMYNAVIGALPAARAAAEGLAERAEAKQRGADMLRECLEIEYAGRKDAEAERGLAEMRAARWKDAAKTLRRKARMWKDAYFGEQRYAMAMIEQRGILAQDVARWQAARLHEHQRAEALAEQAERAAGRLRAIIALIEDPRSVGAEHFDTGAVYDAILEDARAAIAALEVKP
jgi:cell division septum initiation protein DivIVA